MPYKPFDDREQETTATPPPQEAAKVTHTIRPNWDAPTPTVSAPKKQTAPPSAGKPTNFHAVHLDDDEYADYLEHKKQREMKKSLASGFAEGAQEGAQQFGYRMTKRYLFAPGAPKTPPAGSDAAMAARYPDVATPGEPYTPVRGGKDQGPGSVAVGRVPRAPRDLQAPTRARGAGPRR